MTVINLAMTRRFFVVKNMEFIMKRIFLIILISTLFYCSGWDGEIREENGVTYIDNLGEGIWKFEEKKGITFEKVMELGKETGDEEYIFAQISSMTLDENLNIYIYDPINKNLRKFDRDGKFLLKFNLTDENGKELTPLKILGAGNGLVYTFNYEYSEFRIFTYNGKHTGSKRIKSYDLLQNCNLKVFRDGSVVTLSLFDEEPGMVMNRYDGEMNLTQKTELPSESGIKFFGAFPLGFSFDFISEDFIVMISPFKYEIRLFDNENNLKTVITRKDKFYKAPSVENVPVLNGSFFGPLYELSDGKKVLFVDHQSGRKWIDLFDSDWKFLKHTRHPAGKPVFKTVDDFVYFIVFDPYPHIEKYRVIISDQR